MEVLGEAFEWLIQEAQYTVVQRLIGLFALFEAKVKESGKPANMPFNSWMDTSAIRGYVEVSKQVLCAGARRTLRISDRCSRVGLRDKGEGKPEEKIKRTQGM